LGAAKYTVIDASSGAPIIGAAVKQSTVAGWCNAYTATQYTNQAGQTTIDDNCWTDATVNYQVTAAGYNSESGSAQLNIGFMPEITVSLNKLANSQGPCPLGYVMYNGQCVKSSGTQILGTILDWIKTNWLFVLVLLFAIVFAILLLWKPQILFGSAIKA
jgi:5-hydroxyisourate hydrolase-like protein (transthyretin family)